MRRILALLCVLWAVPAFAQCTGSSPTWTCTANSTEAQIQSCVNGATAGDTINIGAGSATWSTGITIGKPLSIIGAGSGVGGTILTGGGKGTLLNGFFYIAGFTSSSLVRVSGFSFVMSLATPANPEREQYGVRVAGMFPSLRIDHNKFTGGNYQIEVVGMRGVIDNNYFTNGNLAVSLDGGTRAEADASWASMAAGTSEALFIETNDFVDTIEGQERIGTENGGKLVVRYNHFDFDGGTYDTTAAPFMAHGNACGGCSTGTQAYWQNDSTARRGQSVIEFYNNTMHGRRIDFMYISRGSANLIHNNEITGTVLYSPRIYFYEEEQWLTAQFSPSRTAWPAEDQVHNSFIWGNTYNGSAHFDQSDDIGTGAYQNSGCTAAATPIACCTGSGTGTCDFIVKDRDFFLHEPQATGGYESFTGANGASGSYPTNGSTYPTSGTMVWNASGANAYYGYTPYIYPHPLTGAAVPNAPTNVRIR